MTLTRIQADNLLSVLAEAYRVIPECGSIAQARARAPSRSLRDACRGVCGSGV